MPGDIHPKDILTKSYKALAIQAAVMASTSEVFRKELIELALKNEMPYSSRAAWAMLSLAEQHPDLVTPYTRSILNKLGDIQNHTQISSLLRLFLALDHDLDESGQLLDFCFHMIRVPLEREYSRALAMDIMLRFALTYPELTSEIIEQIEDARPQFKARHAKRKAKQVLEQLNKMQEQSR
ncbi:MAG: hypothetical protein RIC15_00925 [Vicingaceae bacterium]